jgi:hypothetical protein
MSFLFFNPLAQPLDDNGDPMPECYLQFYEHDSTTPTPVYADADMETELSNPVVANAAGRFVPIYMDPAVVYRVLLFDAADVEQWDVDPIHAHVAFPPGTVVMFDGTAEERDAAYPPALWELCDGDNGTKDTRDRCPVGVSNTKPISGAGSTGGTASGTTDPDGAHDHGGDTGDTVLEAANMPVHNHRLYVKTASDSDNETFGFGNATTEGLTGQLAADGPYGYVEAGLSEAGDPLVEEAGAADPDGHDHTITEELDHTHGFSAQSPYFTMWFLKRKP